MNVELTDEMKLRLRHGIWEDCVARVEDIVFVRVDGGADEGVEEMMREYCREVVAKVLDPGDEMAMSELSRQ